LLLLLPRLLLTLLMLLMLLMLLKFVKIVINVKKPRQGVGIKRVGHIEYL